MWGGGAGGLHNLGNTCFANSVLQALVRCGPFAEAVGSSAHGNLCQKQGRGCLLCEVERLTKRCQTAVGSIRPDGVIDLLPTLSPSFVLGTQQDAHEFLRLLVHGLQQCFPSHQKDRTPQPYPFQLFAGAVESSVVCEVCRAVSTTVDPVEDIQLDIHDESQSIQESLLRFVGSERLPVESGYRCEKCKVSVPAVKQTRMLRMPRILVLHLKRFTYGGLFGSKITKKVDYPSRLDMSQYFTGDQRRNKVTAVGTLSAVVVHHGYSMMMGHYTCYARMGGRWHHFNDERVTRVSEEEALNQEAYLLFYEMEIDDPVLGWHSPRMSFEALKAKRAPPEPPRPPERTRFRPIDVHPSVTKRPRQEDEGDASTTDEPSSSPNCEHVDTTQGSDLSDHATTSSESTLEKADHNEPPAVLFGPELPPGFQRKKSRVAAPTDWQYGLYA